MPTATFGTPSYDLNVISIVVTLSESVEGISATDFDIQQVSGDGIYQSNSELIGSGTAWTWRKRVADGHKGVFSIELTGRVRTTATPALSTATSSQRLLVPYNTTAPEIVDAAVPDVVVAGENFVYFDFDQVCTGLRQGSFDYAGTVDDPNMPILEAANTTTRPAADSSDWMPYNDNTQPRQFFRIKFTFSDPPPAGNLNVSLKEGECFSVDAQQISPIPPSIPDRLDFTRDQAATFTYDWALPIGVTISSATTADTLPAGITITHTDSSVTIGGTGTAIFDGDIDLVVSFSDSSPNYTKTITLEVNPPAASQQNGAMGQGATGQQGTVPTLTMADVVIYRNEDFNVSGTINGTYTKVYVEGLLRNWRYDDSTTGTIRMLGDAADVETVEQGVWDVIIEYLHTPGMDTPLSFDSGALSGTDSAQTTDPINYGEVSNTEIERLAHGNGYIYKTTTLIRNLRVRASANYTGTFAAFGCRYSTTQPTVGADLFEFGTLLDSSFVAEEVDGTISGDVAEDTYFWFAPLASSTVSISNRRLRLNYDVPPAPTTESVTYDAPWQVSERPPVITNPGTQTVYLDTPMRIPISISGRAGGVSVKGLLAKMYFQSDESGAEVLGTPDRIVTATENRQIVVDASTSGGDDQESFQLVVQDTSVVVVDVNDHVVSIFSIAGASGDRAEEEKNIPLPTGRLTSQGIMYLGNERVAVINTNPTLVSIFSIAGASGDRAEEEKNIPLPTGRTTPVGITYLGNDRVAVVEFIGPVVSIFSIAGANGDRAEEEKNIPLPTGRTAPIGITYLGNKRVAVVDRTNALVSIFSIAGASGDRAEEEKNIPLPTGRTAPSGITYLGNDRVAVVDTTGDIVSIFSIAGANGDVPEEEKTILLPTGRIAPSGITLLAPPPMSTVTVAAGSEQATFTWMAVAGATSYAYRIGEMGEWIDVGNVTSYTISEGLMNGQSYDVYWRVNSPWIGMPVSLSVSIIQRVTVASRDRDDIGIFDISGVNDSIATLNKTLNLPSGWGNSNGITSLDNNKVAVVDNGRDDIGIFDISGANDTDATLDKFLNLPSGWGSPSGITSLGNNKVAVVDATRDDIGIFDISGANDTDATLDKRLHLLSGWHSPTGITPLGNNKVAVVDSGRDDIGIFDISGANDSTITPDKYLNLPSGWNPSGITSLGNNKVAVVDNARDDIGIFDISGANDTDATLDKYLNLPSGWGNSNGITLYSGSDLGGDDTTTPHSLLFTIPSNLSAYGITIKDDKIIIMTFDNQIRTYSRTGTQESSFAWSASNVATQCLEFTPNRYLRGQYTFATEQNRQMQIAHWNTATNTVSSTTTVANVGTNRFGVISAMTIDNTSIYVIVNTQDNDFVYKNTINIITWQSIFTGTINANINHLFAAGSYLYYIDSITESSITLHARSKTDWSRVTSADKSLNTGIAIVGGIRDVHYDTTNNKLYIVTGSDNVYELDFAGITFS